LFYFELIHFVAKTREIKRVEKLMDRYSGMEEKSAGATANSSAVSLPIKTGICISALNPHTINIPRICETLVAFA